MLLADGATGHRPILEEYSPYLLDQMISVVTASTLVAYAIYTVSPETVQKFGTDNLGLTLPFPLYGIFRYLYLVHQKEGGGSPADMLLNDRPLLACVALWAIAVAAIIYWDQSDVMAKAKVAMLKTSPGTVLRDYHSLMNLAGLPGRRREGRRHRAEGEHLLAFLLSRRARRPRGSSKASSGR